MWQMGGGGQQIEKSADVIYGQPLTQKIEIIYSSHSVWLIKNNLSQHM